MTTDKERKLKASQPMTLYKEYAKRYKRDELYMCERLGTKNKVFFDIDWWIHTDTYPQTIPNVQETSEQILDIFTGRLRYALQQLGTQDDDYKIELRSGHKPCLKAGVSVFKISFHIVVHSLNFKPEENKKLVEMIEADCKNRITDPDDEANKYLFTPDKKFVADTSVYHKVHQLRVLGSRKHYIPKEKREKDWKPNDLTDPRMLSHSNRKVDRVPTYEEFLNSLVCIPQEDAKDLKIPGAKSKKRKADDMDTETPIQKKKKFRNRSKV